MTQDRPNITIFDDQGSEPLIRKMNDEEYERHLAFLASIDEEEQAQEAREAARLATLAKLEALGLTPEDLAAL